ncbi:hypothetical protein [Thermocrinis sp.]|uniref:hypothetical protein n=1 Tax=Thermocrinis sp. TaxID=2024383 RepID=UPI002FDDF6BE
MSAKAEFIVLKKMLVNEWDLLAYIYGTVGKGRIFVRNGFHPQNAYCAIFEPFNILKVYCHHSGGLLILDDVIEVKFYSYLALKNFRRFSWMTKVVQTVVGWISYYDSFIFNLLQNYLKIDVKNYKVFEIKLKLELIKSLGVYREDIFENSLAEILNKINREDRIENLEELSLSESLYRKITQHLEDILKKSLD